MTAMRRAVVAALLFLVACEKIGYDGVKISRDDARISHVSKTLSATPRFDRGPTRVVFTIEFTLPHDFPIDHDDPFITMTDTSGRRFEAKEMTISTTGDGKKMVEGVRAQFELVKDSKPGVLHIGDDYDVDISSGRITRRASGSTAP